MFFFVVDDQKPRGRLSVSGSLGCHVLFELGRGNSSQATAKGALRVVNQRWREKDFGGASFAGVFLLHVRSRRARLSPLRLEARSFLKVFQRVLAAHGGRIEAAPVFR